MLTRTVLAALAATAVAAGGSTTAVLVAGTPSDTALKQRAPRAAEARSGAESAQGAEAAAVTPPPCPADVKNHGAYVSSVARGAKADGVQGADRGALVSAAAQSDCGKP